MDLEKLSPAPWHVRESESHRGNWILADANDEYIATFEIKEIAERVALARNAFDVMMRRGWTAQLIDTQDGPKSHWHVDVGVRGQRTKSFSDPFAALGEADAWYKENLEKSHG